MSPEQPTADSLPRPPLARGDALRRHVEDAYRRRFGDDPALVVRAPGRVNLLGAHVDYSEGWVLPAAIDRAVYLAAGPAPGAAFEVESLDYRDHFTQRLDALPPPVPERREQGGSWRDLPLGVAWALGQADGEPPAGLRAVFAADLPAGAGVSSSAAVEVAFLLAWEALRDDDMFLDKSEMARIGQRGENEYLGVGSGVMDQFASLLGEADHALCLDCRHLTYHTVPLPPEARFLVADSGVRRRLGASGFNDRRAECEQAVEILRRHDDRGHLRTLRDLTPHEFELLAHHLPITLRRRALHAVGECERVVLGAADLEKGDLGAFARCMRASHASSRDLYEVSLPELDVLAAAAWRVDGCWGARLSGGGFGGCVTAFVHADAAEAVARAMGETFEAEFGRRPPIFECRAADGATVLPP